MKTLKECKDEIARNNNFDSFDRAMRYTFNRELLQSEKEFIDKIIDEAMILYAEQQVKNLNIPAVIKAVCPKCGSKYYDEDNYVKQCQDCYTVY